MDTYSGYIAIVGRPNVGKSSLMNRILGQKIGITSSKSQTTRDYICGIKTTNNKQSIYIDTPGIIKSKGMLHSAMNKNATRAIGDADINVFVIDSRGWRQADDIAWSKIVSSKKPVILVLNKIDLLANKSAVLPLIQELHAKLFAEVQLIDIVPVSAKQGYNLLELEQLISQQLNQGVHFYPQDQITNKTEKFLVAELVREQLMRYLGDELPYRTAVEIESFVEKTDITQIHALIWVGSESHKPIVIGKKGELLKKVGTNARVNIQELLETKVMLKLWVKVKSKWYEQKNLLEYLGYTE